MSGKKPKTPEDGEISGARRAFLEKECRRLIGLFESGSFVFGITIDPKIYLEMAVSADAETDYDIIKQLVMRQYPFIASVPGLVKFIKAVDDEKCIVAESYRASRPDTMRIAYVGLDPAFFDIDVTSDDSKLRPTMRATLKSRPDAGFCMIYPSGNTARLAGTRDFVLAYDSLGGFFEGSTAIARGFSIMLSFDVDTYRSIIASAHASMEKNSKN